MKKILFICLFFAELAMTTTIRAQILSGDLNYNGDLDVEDITLLINGYLTGEKVWINVPENMDNGHELTTTTHAHIISGDLNHNGDLDVEDITLLINGYLTGEKEWINVPENMDNGHEFVDLGLSVMWATTNIGANAPEEYGDYFAWGETTPKDYYGWSTYTWCNGSSSTLTKYCTDSKYGTVDNKTVLELSDDAAHVNWGGSWRMPTSDELFKELKIKCTWTWTTQNGVNGYKVTGPNGNSIFLPAAGLRFDSSHSSAGSFGGYWSSSLTGSIKAGSVLFNSSGVSWLNYNRDEGQNVRAVCPKINHEYEYVDLGLSVKWATMNIGAYVPEEYGEYFAWGETTPKDCYDWSTYRWGGSSSTLTKYCTSSNNGTVDNKTTLDFEDDAARANWGGTWRMPTDDEFSELVGKCTWEWTTKNGVNGYKVTGSNGNSIFLPAAGVRGNRSLINAGYNGEYWASSLRSKPCEGWATSDDDWAAYRLVFSPSDVLWYYDNRICGKPVRAVCP